jgi:flagellin FlaB
MSTHRSLVTSREGAMGIGSLIMFIAMLLVAGMAASVLIQTMNELNKQALDTGRQTIREVASGISVMKISGAVNGSNISQMALLTTPVAGSDDIDLYQTHITLSDTNKQVNLFYDSNYFNNSPSNSLFATMDLTGLDATSFGIIVIRDYDNSCDTLNPIINSHDIIALMVNTSACFGDGSPTSGIGPRTELSGGVYPEFGMRGVIRCTTPSAFINTIVDLQ